MPHPAAKRGRVVHLAGPAYTTMDCGACGARAKSRAPLPVRTFRCGTCGVVLPRTRTAPP
jgi:putative transposase